MKRFKEFQCNRYGLYWNHQRYVIQWHWLGLHVIMPWFYFDIELTAEGEFRKW